MGQQDPLPAMCVYITQLVGGFQTLPPIGLRVTVASGPDWGGGGHKGPRC